MKVTKSLYAVLGVKKTATPDEIKAAYRAGAKKSHPDRNPGDPTAETRFRLIQFAYDVLSDPVRRAAYDKDGTVEPPDKEAGKKRASMLDLLSEIAVNVLSNMAATGKSPASCNVLKRMAAKVTEVQKELESRRAAQQKMVDGFRAVAGRAKVKDGEPDYIGGIARQHLEAAEAKLKDIADRLDVTKLALDCLARYTYAHDGKGEDRENSFFNPNAPYNVKLTYDLPFTGTCEE